MQYYFYLISNLRKCIKDFYNTKLFKTFLSYN